MIKKIILSSLVAGALCVSANAADIKSSEFELPTNQSGYTLKEASTLNMRNTLFLKSDVDNLIRQVNADNKILIANQQLISGLRTENNLLREKLTALTDKIAALELRLPASAVLTKEDSLLLKTLEEKINTLSASIDENKEASKNDKNANINQSDMKIKIDPALLEFVSKTKKETKK